MPDLLSMYTGIRYIYQGQQRYSREAMSKAVRYFGYAFIVILLVMLIHFKSFNQVLIIIAMIPLSMLGVFWGHGIHGEPLSMISMLGMVALTGVIINDAIVFLAKYDGLLLEGKTVFEAVVEAGKVRLRPIILTSLTTVIGLLPILLERSQQSQFLVPMAISLAYGVFFGTIFILIFFPVLITLLNDILVYTKHLWTGTRPEREDVEVAIIHHKRKLRYERNGKNGEDSEGQDRSK
jgi:multidrug efflux pump subunit AcrB